MSFDLFIWCNSTSPFDVIWLHHLMSFDFVIWSHHLMSFGLIIWCHLTSSFDIIIWCHLTFLFDVICPHHLMSFDLIIQCHLTLSFNVIWPHHLMSFAPIIWCHLTSSFDVIWPHHLISFDVIGLCSGGHTYSSALALLLILLFSLPLICIFAIPLSATVMLGYDDSWVFMSLTRFVHSFSIIRPSISDLGFPPLPVKWHQNIADKIYESIEESGILYHKTARWMCATM